MLRNINDIENNQVFSNINMDKVLILSIKSPNYPPLDKIDYNVIDI